MADSLRDQLLKSGLAKPKPKMHAKPRKAQSVKGRSGSPTRDTRDASTEEMDLARAYALRKQDEARERRRQQRDAEEQARERRERKRKLHEALQGHALNKDDAHLMRHFQYRDKIRRVHVDAAQMQAINAGELGVIQQAGRYVIVTRERAESIRAFASEHVALLVDPDAAEPDDGVPDDLIW